MNKRWLHLWLSLVVVGYVVLSASLPAGAQTPTATPTTTSTPQTCIEASSATVTQSNALTFYAAIWAGGTTTVPDRPELTWNKPGFLPGDYYGWVGHITMRSAGNPPELWQYDTSNNWHPASTPGSFQITYHTNYVAISTPFNVPAIQFDVSLCPGSITPTPTLPAAQQTATAAAQQTATAAAQQTATAAAQQTATAAAATHQTPTPITQPGCQFIPLRVNPNVGANLVLPQGSYQMYVSWPAIAPSALDDGFYIAFVDQPEMQVTYPVHENELVLQQKVFNVNIAPPFEQVGFIFAGAMELGSASDNILITVQICPNAATPTPDALGCQSYTVGIVTNAANTTGPTVSLSGAYSVNLSWPAGGTTNPTNDPLLTINVGGSWLTTSANPSRTTYSWSATVSARNGKLAVVSQYVTGTATVQLCPPTFIPTAQPAPTPKAGCIQYDDDVSSELQRNIFLFAGAYTFYFVFFGQTYHLDAVIQFELADFSGAPVYRWNIDGTAFNAGEFSRTETIQTVDGYYNFSGLYPEMEGQNVFTIICNAGGTPTPYATYTPTTTVGPLTPTSTSTPTSTPTPTNTSTPTNTPSPTATFLPGTPAPPTAFPQIIDAPAECTICPPTPTLNTSPMPELGIVLPTLASGDVVVSGTVTISITAILAAVQTVQSGITTPVASLSTTTAFFSWQAGQAQATSWAGQMQPALNWLTILNPTHPAYTSVGGPLWALAPILLPVLPIISASLIVAFVRFFIWVGAWILKVIDVIFKLIELIPGE